MSDNQGEIEPKADAGVE